MISCSFSIRFDLINEGIYYIIYHDPTNLNDLSDVQSLRPLRPTSDLALYHASMSRKECLLSQMLAPIPSKLC